MSRARSVRLPDNLDGFILRESRRTNKSYTEMIIDCIKTVRNNEYKTSQGEEWIEKLCEITCAYNKLLDEQPGIDLSELGEAVGKLWQ